MNFTDEYYPTLDELSSSALADARAKVVSLLQPAFPDVDLSPSTPTGDLVVSALGAFWAATAEANNRFMSDLDLENVANGVIFSCDFVRAYLGNFAVYDVDNLRSTGIVRLSFSSPSARALPLAARFRFGGQDDYSIQVSSGATSIQVLGAGSVHDGQPDTYVLAQTSATTWAVDLPLTGAMTSPVTKGTAGMSTTVDPDLIGIAAAIDFLPGLPSASLSDLARLARKTAYSLTSGSRASTQSLVLRNWPEVVMVSPVITGDVEMQRSPAASAMILQAPAIDVYLRSSRDMQKETQVVRLDYVTAAIGGSTKKVFRGHVNFLHTPSRILSVEWSGASDTSYVDSYTLFTRPTRSDLPGSLHCGTRYEAFELEVAPVMSGADPLIPRFDIIEGELTSQYAMFTIVYEADPLLEVVASTLESSDNTPVGVSVLVRSGPLVTLDNLTISFVKQQGVRTTLTATKEAIVAYLLSAGYPDAFRQTVLHDIMRAAGADRVLGMTCYGSIRPTPATRRFFPNVDAYVAYTEDWDAASETVSPLSVSSLDEIIPSVVINEEFGDGHPEMWAATARTLRYRIDPENITFIEQQP